MNAELDYASNAKAAYESFIKLYYRNHDFIDCSFWNRAEILQVLEDAYEILKDESYKTYIKEVCDKVIEVSTEDWSMNPFYDDRAWMCIAFIRASKLLEDKHLADIAKTNLETIWLTGKDATHGGMYWRRRTKTQHTVTVCPSSIAACLIGDYFNDQSWYTKAIEVMDWELNTLYNAETGYVYDHIDYKDDSYDGDEQIDRSEFTYNYGSFVGACAYLYKHTNNEKYKTAAERVVLHVTHDYFEDGLMTKKVQSTHDAAGFLGIMARWFRVYASTFEHPEIQDWLKENAELAWSNRNSDNIASHFIDRKASDHAGYHPFSVSSYISILINAV